MSLETEGVQYEDWLAKLFDPAGVDGLALACILTRSSGIEGPRADPLLESRDLTRDLRLFARDNLRTERFPDPDLTRWRLRLIAYAQLVEMDAPYLVLANLLRLRNGLPYSLSPFVDLYKKRDKEEAKPPKKFRLGIPSVSVTTKLDKMDSLARKVGFPEASSVFDRFYFTDLRNAIQHADYSIDSKHFMMGSGSVPEKDGANVLTPYVELERLDQIVSRAEIFYATFFAVEEAMRKGFAPYRGKALAFDQYYKGLLEFLIDENDLLCGWKVHWPNGADSYFSRTSKGCKAVNWSFSRHGISLMVGLKHGEQGSAFSELLRDGEPPRYSPCEGCDGPPSWPGDQVELGDGSAGGDPQPDSD